MINSRIRRALGEAHEQALAKLDLQQNNSFEPKAFVHGAAVLNGPRVIGAGYNQYSRNYIQGTFYLSMHAEMAALNNSNLPTISLLGKRGTGQCSKVNHCSSVNYEELQQQGLQVF